MNVNDYFKYKKRIIVKIGSSSLIHTGPGKDSVSGVEQLVRTGNVNYTKVEKLVRELCDLRGMGMDVCLVSSGAIAVGRSTIGLPQQPDSLPARQACAAVGQGRLMMMYQRMFSEYNQVAAQILITKNTILNDHSRANTQNTFEELFHMGVIPIVNENDTVSTYEMQFGDNDTLSAIVASLTDADLLILLSDIDGLYTDDPRQNPDAKLVERVDKIDQHLLDMGKGSTGSNVGTGGMNTKLHAANIAMRSGCDMLIVNSHDVGIIHQIIEGEFKGTLFKAQKEPSFDLRRYIRSSVDMESHSVH